MRLRLLASCALALTLAAGTAAHAEGAAAQGGQDLPAFDASDAAAAPVTAETLLTNDRFWPYRVALADAWKPPGATARLAAGTTGVLIRVEGDGATARIDFGRDGLFDVPVAATDLVARADQVRRGALEKDAPNFAAALGPRLLDAGATPPRPFFYPTVLAQRVFVTVFADPGSDDFAALAAELAPLRDRPGVLTLLLPQGSLDSSQVGARLAALGWPVPYVFDYLAAPYTRTLLPADLAPPAVMLQTNEGRVLYQAAWRPGVAAQLASALDRELAPTVGATQP